MNGSNAACRSVMAPPRETRPGPLRVRQIADGRLLLRFAQVLSLSALCIWNVMLWVPVVASPEDSSEPPHPPRIIVTALGGPPFDLEEARGSMVLVAVGVLVCAAASFLLTVRSRPDSHPWPDVVGRLWSAGTLFLSVCVFLVLANTLANLPTIMWDAVDDRGALSSGWSSPNRRWVQGSGPSAVSACWPRESAACSAITAEDEPTTVNSQRRYLTRSPGSPCGRAGTERIASRSGCRG